jgi:archaellin
LLTRDLQHLEATVVVAAMVAVDMAAMVAVDMAAVVATKAMQEGRTAFKKRTGT